MVLADFVFWGGFLGEKGGGIGRVVRWASVFGLKNGVRLWKRLQICKNLHKCFETWDNSGEKVDRKLEKYAEIYVKKAGWAGKRGEIGY